MIPQQTSNAIDKAHRHAGSPRMPRKGSYLIARLLMRFDNWLLSLVGLEHNETLFTWIYVILVFLVAIAAGYVAKFFILAIVKRIGKHLLSDWYQNLTQIHSSPRPAASSRHWYSSSC